MNSVGLQVVEALQGLFPQLDITARERAYGCVLGITFKHNDRRFLLETPDTLDYRHYDYRYWVHRTAEKIREKTQ